VPDLQKVILYYGFTPIADPNAVRLWQRDLCEGLGLTGRIIISSHGINGTLGGPMKALKKYVSKTRQLPGLSDMDVKWSMGTGEEFPRLQVRARDEIVTFGVPDELKVEPGGVVGGGIHLSPQEVNDLVAARGDEVVFFDGRNEYEARVGRFKGAVVPDINTTRDFVGVLDSGAYDHLKDKPIVTYCTGGIRCEVLSALMRNRGFNEVYQIRGGIVRYGEQFGNDGLWEGSLYVFDGRMTHDFAENPAIIGRCESCGTGANQYRNCVDLRCRELSVLCDACVRDTCTHVAS
jgi:UPF0176 protein